MTVDQWLHRLWCCGWRCRCTYSALRERQLDFGADEKWCIEFVLGLVMIPSFTSTARPQTALNLWMWFCARSERSPLSTPSLQLGRFCGKQQAHLSPWQQPTWEWCTSLTSRQLKARRDRQTRRASGRAPYILARLVSFVVKRSTWRWMLCIAGYSVKVCLVDLGMLQFVISILPLPSNQKGLMEAREESNTFECDGG